MKDLVGLPPTLLITYQLDPTRDEALALAERLGYAGVPTELHHYAGAFHLIHTHPGTSIGSRILGDKYAAIGRILARLIRDNATDVPVTAWARGPGCSVNMSAR